MTTPPPDGNEPVVPLDFDPYRFGLPDHEIDPQYAPVGYRPTPELGPPPRVAPPLPPHARGQQRDKTQQRDKGQQPEAYPPPYGTYRKPAQAARKAKTARILGILSLACFWLGILDIVFIALAITFGSVGMRAAKREGDKRAHSRALAGLICGVIAAILVVVSTVYVYNKYKDCANNYTSVSAYMTCVENHP